jgi:uncharacterized protein
VRARFGLVLCAAAVTAGCGSSPSSTFYALGPSQGIAQAGAPHAIKLRRVTIPGYLDRPEIVRRVVDFRLGVAAYERWGEPLDAMLGRVLAEDLEQRLPGSSVFTEDGAITAEPDATVEIELRRFDVGANGEVNLVAEVASERGPGHQASTSRAVVLHATPKDATTAALVAAMSELLGQLADQVSMLLRVAAGS